MPKSAGTDLWSRTPINNKPKNTEASNYARPGPHELAMETEVQRYIDAGASTDMRPLCIGIPKGRPCVRPIKNSATAYCEECGND